MQRFRYPTIDTNCERGKNHRSNHQGLQVILVGDPAHGFLHLGGLLDGSELNLDLPTLLVEFYHFFQRTLLGRQVADVEIPALSNQRPFLGGGFVFNSLVLLLLGALSTLQKRFLS